LDAEILRLASSDAPSAKRALACIKPAGERARRVTVAACRSFLRDERNVFLGAFANGEPVGYAIAYLLERPDREAPMVLFYEVEVLAGWRRQGIGRAMVDRLAQFAKERGACKMWVLTEEANAAAQALYTAAEAHGTGPHRLFTWHAEDGTLR
jgi:GNAT superfamily N-acetyltransferase